MQASIWSLGTAVDWKGSYANYLLTQLMAFQKWKIKSLWLFCKGIKGVNAAAHIPFILIMKVIVILLVTLYRRSIMILHMRTTMTLHMREVGLSYPCK
jgi:hypothetical protein